MYARCSSCEQEAADKAQNSVANQAKPMSVGTITEKQREQAAYKQVMDWCGEGAASSGIVTNTPPPIQVPVADILQQRLCDELANLSRNVAGLTGVAKTLMDQKQASLVVPVIGPVSEEEVTAAIAATSYWEGNSEKTRNMLEHFARSRGLLE
jgi:hypothetical protein